jgi:cleavage and polyadenylation specificity factor subunit 3
MSLNAEKNQKVKVFSPRNCEELMIPFKADKTAKVVGKLAAITPPTSGANKDDTQLITGVLVQNDFKMSLMAPEDLREYSGLTTTTITCKQRMRLSTAGIDLVKWALEGTFGSIETLPLSPVSEVEKTNGEDTHMNGTEDSTPEPETTTAYLVMGCITIRHKSNGEIELEWEGNMLNDGIADAVMAVLFSVESSPAAVKRTSLELKRTRRGIN